MRNYCIILLTLLQGACSHVSEPQPYGPLPSDAQVKYSVKSSKWRDGKGDMEEPMRPARLIAGHITMRMTLLQPGSAQDVLQYSQRLLRKTGKEGDERL